MVEDDFVEEGGTKDRSSLGAPRSVAGLKIPEHKWQAGKEDTLWLMFNVQGKPAQIRKANTGDLGNRTYKGRTLFAIPTPSSSRIRWESRWNPYDNGECCVQGLAHASAGWTACMGPGWHRWEHHIKLAPRRAAVSTRQANPNHYFNKESPVV